ncbi:hypothetical protein DPMN_020602 [Dreissena polymorpha]|uniref:Uncharacterized protein n=1 Tax=Dreissena polymorpha TaxID=45954 RepID=A0A9D4NLB8_DREPO|nr:hypothetical protein DPMN_020602 [Dreissena polymorpha]
MRLTPFNKSCCRNSRVWGGAFGVGTHSIYGPVAAAAVAATRAISSILAVFWDMGLHSRFLQDPMH